MSEINVLYPFDNNYASHAGVSLTSLLENNRHADSIHVYVLGFDLCEESIQKLQKTVSNYGRDLIWLDPTRIETKIRELKLPAYRGASVAVARLFVSDFITEDVDRLLYLDSDTIIVGDLTDLVNENLEGNPAGMVCDSCGRDYKKYLGFTSDEDYFNGGMIVYDLPKWREQKCTEKITDHIQNVRSQYEALDQDLINIVLKGKIKRLDLRYNFQPFHRVYSPEIYEKVYGAEGYYNNTTIQKASQNVVILHAFRYLGSFPWHKNTPHPYVKEYEHYKQISEWKDMKPDDQPSKGMVLSVECILQRILPRIVFLRLFRMTFKYQMRSIDKKLRKKKECYSNI